MKIFTKIHLASAIFLLMPYAFAAKEENKISKCPHPQSITSYESGRSICFDGRNSEGKLFKGSGCILRHYGEEFNFKPHSFVPEYSHYTAYNKKLSCEYKFKKYAAGDYKGLVNVVLENVGDY